MKSPFETGKELIVWQVDGVAPMKVVSTPVQKPGRKVMHWQHVTLNYDIPGAVAIAVDAKTDRIALVKEWRLPVKKQMIEIPRGRGRENESTIETAMRELLEETGLEAKTTVDLGFIYPDSGTLSAPIGVAAMTVKDALGTGVTDGEVDSWFWASEKEINSMIVNGEFTDSISLAALQLWSAHGKPKP